MSIVFTIKRSIIIVIVMAITAADAVAVPLDDELLQKLVSKYSYQKIVCLDVGEQYTFVLKSGTKKNIKLLSVSEYRDTVLKKPRWANVDIEVDGKAIRLKWAPYVMPAQSASTQDASFTSGLKLTLG